MAQSKEVVAEPRLFACARVATAVLTHFLGIILTGFVAFLARPGTSWFSWHPFLMTLAFSFFMTEAILLFSPHGSPIKRFSHKVKGRVHWILQCACVTCATLGLVSIFYNKHLLGKSHFTSWHGVLGLITVCVAAVQSLSAVPLIYHSLAKGWSLAKLKRYHAASGLVTYLLGSVSLLLGLTSVWFTASVSEFTWYLAALCPTFSALIMMNQVTSAYVARKRFQS
ncbi:transmembrane reductase CYB561D2 [Corythoichthys intestinalis]|uniref:transmembrane reductase CYB561D2 n=1 Tax=Corythoichthys intestinalis TaxID=161448 RepID=UPI0025A578C7|nr:transmembrane reductase CYB561D2 [Corythoichthys intestinalis]XP_061813447.1 transmembrane reductase CYB561D2 [Nerophis lumbriciformis]